MTFLLDHDVPDSIARVIAQAGHASRRLRDLLPPDSDDRSVLVLAHSRQAVLVTCNRDHFLSLAQTIPHAGIIVLVRRRTRVTECSRFLRLLNRADESGIRNNINFA
ncbi:MAG: DUF5615 family PIN-like protein [Verrucomicrobia bacterium]|nr:DUF5615 family PIN-like protein [Verrucomicrobiota bacterium]